ncbi:MAG: class I SAM-dependent methyltransferase [Defluviitaleaceae bacterium]|nr:class I SAM-dependent methyltransferase [Defluviitaleaceae bacterium]
MFTQTLNNIPLTFETTSTVFSPTCIDKGTLAMLQAVDLSPADKLLDLGCGYGIVGIYAAKCIGEQNIVMSDSNKKCIELSKKNAETNGVSGVKIIQSDGFKDIDDKDFTLILSNPPYHVNFSVPKHFIEKGFNRLQIGGKMFMVTKRKDWYKNKFTAIFGGVKILEIDGYFVFCAEKRGMQYANVKLTTKKAAKPKPQPKKGKTPAAYKASRS